MVRMENNEEEATSVRKKIISKKKPPTTGIWPCKMNGCNKQFAREADLKRHQRTTKLHSMPGFACPQCDATFTRTDALRRHQKSRHNGVVIEPIDQERKESDEQGQSSSRSSSATPSYNGKERASVAVAHTTQGLPSAFGPATGHSSYYRSHTATSTPYQPPRATAGARWTSAHPWPDGRAPPPIGQVAYMYFPTPYYRNTNSTVSPSPNAPPSAAAAPTISPPNDTQVESQTPQAKATSPASTSESSPRDSNEKQIPTASIDSGLESSPSSSPKPTDPDHMQHMLSLETAQAAMVAVLKSAETPEKMASEGLSFELRSIDNQAAWNDSDGDDGERLSPMSGGCDHSGAPHILREHGYGARLDRPEPMEHMLTEDGEPMLNPAELLTQVGWVALYDEPGSASDSSTSQESLASPEPS